MNPRHLLFLGAALVIALAVWLALTLTDAGGGPRRVDPAAGDDALPLFADFDRTRVTRLEFAGPEPAAEAPAGDAAADPAKKERARITLQRRGEDWLVAGEVEYPAENRRAREALWALARVQRHTLIGREAKFHDDFGVSAARGSRVRAQDDAGAVLADFYYGRGEEWKPPSEFELQEMAFGENTSRLWSHVRLADQDQVYKSPPVVADEEGKAEDWRLRGRSLNTVFSTLADDWYADERRLLPTAGTIDELSLRLRGSPHSDDDFRVRRDGEGKWEIEGAGSKDFRQWRGDDLRSLAGDLRFARLAPLPADEAALGWAAPWCVATLRLAGETPRAVTLTIGAKDEAQYQYPVRIVPPPRAGYDLVYWVPVTAIDRFASPRAQWYDDFAATTLPSANPLGRTASDHLQSVGGPRK